MTEFEEAVSDLLTKRRKRTPVNWDEHTTETREESARLLAIARKQVMSELPKFKRYCREACWAGEIGVKPNKRQFTYENYAVNADKLYKILDKEE